MTDSSIHFRKVALVESEDSDDEEDDSGGLPELIPVSRDGSFGHLEGKEVGSDQQVVSINMRQWERFVEIFGIEEAMVRRGSEE